MTQVQALELMRKRYATCQKTCSDIAATLMLDEAAASFRLRGGPDKEEVPVKRISVSQESLDKLGAQLLWLRSAQSELDRLFTGRHADALRQELQSMTSKISALVDKAVADRKFPKMETGAPTKLLHEGVQLVMKEAKTYLKGKLTTSEIITLNKRDAPFYTVFIIAKNVKTADSIIPTYILAVSESTETILNKRKRYLTHLPEISTQFDPRYIWSDTDDLKRVSEVVLSAHFINDVPSEGTRNIRVKIGIIPGVARTTITKNGALEVQIASGSDIDDVTVAVYKYIVSEIRRTNPMYQGNVTHVESERDGRTYVTFSAPQGMNRPKFKDNKSLQEALKIFEASLVVTASLDLNKLQSIG